MSERRAEHVVVIMDGNGRWASRLGKTRVFGHRRGVGAAREIVRASAEFGVSTLTLFAFSTENQRRPSPEVSALITLFTEALRKEVEELIENGVRLKFIGDLSFFDDGFLHGVHEAEAKTERLGRLQLNVAINYSGRWDVANAVSLALASGEFAAADARDVERALPRYLAVRDVDLLIRTGGERRISNFLLWQSAYAELYFTDVLWPDFDKARYAEALDWYSRRERRFGLTSRQLRRSSGAGG